MGAICCLEKAWMPLHQGSSQNDDRRGQTFSKRLKRRAQKSKRRAQKSKRPIQKSKRPIQKSKRQAQKSKTHFLFQTCQHLSHAHSACGNHLQFVKAPISDIEKAFAFPDVSASVTCTLSLAKITSNLSKISGDVEST
ncbi:hypothetical protein ACFX1Q_020208 [Malus domestica]